MKPPKIFFEGNYTAKNINKFKQQAKLWQVIDIYKQQLNELFEVLHPNLDNKSNQFLSELESYINERGKNENCGNWIYFPWNGIFLHTINQNDYQILRTNRNRELISESEQEKLARANIAVLGLSIGSSIAKSLAYSGISSFELADFDTLATTNLNRVQASIFDIGKSKITSTSEQIYTINPYAKLKLFDHGLSDDQMSQFLSEPKPDIIFEAVDDFAIKIKIRLAARQKKIPVVMLTNLGDNILIDIERFDLDKNSPIFHGILGDLPEKIIKSPITEEDRSKYAVQIVDSKHVPTRALQSVMKIGKTLVGRPQLFSTVVTASGLAVFITKKVLLENDLKSGRYYLSFNQIFGLKSADHDNKDRILSLFQQRFAK